MCGVYLFISLKWKSMHGLIFLLVSVLGEVKREVNAIYISGAGRRVESGLVSKF